MQYYTGAMQYYIEAMQYYIEVMQHCIAIKGYPIAIKGCPIAVKGCPFATKEYPFSVKEHRFALNRIYLWVILLFYRQLRFVYKAGYGISVVRSLVVGRVFVYKIELLKGVGSKIGIVPF